MSAPALAPRRAEVDALLATIEPPPVVVAGMRLLAVLAALAGVVGALVVDGRDEVAAIVLLGAMASPWLLEAAGVAIPRAAFAAMVLAPPAVDLVVRLAVAGSGPGVGHERGWPTVSFGVGGSTSIYLAMLLLLSCALGPGRHLGATAVAALAVYGVRGALESGPYSRLGWAIALLFTVGCCAGVRAGATGIARAQRAAVARDAADRRRQLARDVHDVVAHSMAVTMLHVTAARMALLRDDTGAAAEALDEADRSGRASLADVRRATRILRVDDEPVHGAQPTLADVPALVQSYASAGLDIDATLAAAGDAVDPVIGLTVYRVAQEALANAARHGDGSATVVLAVAGGRVVLDVRNPIRREEPDGAAGAAASAASAGGSGLRGMSERVAAIGGTLTVGPTGPTSNTSKTGGAQHDSHGWRVHLEARAAVRSVAGAT